MPVVWPDDLVTDLARRRCVIFIGAGVSSNSKNAEGMSPPKWEEFLRAGAHAITDAAKRKEIDELVDEKNLLGAGERLKNYLGSRLIDLIRSTFTAPKFLPANIHKNILALDARVVVTTNFDKIYESFANGPDEHSGAIIVKNLSDLELPSVLRRRDRVIIRMHGSADRLDDIILAHADYAKARVRFQTGYETIEALAMTHTFLFLGYSLRDPDIQLMLETHSAKYSSLRYHAATVAGARPPFEEEFYKQVQGVELLPYQAIGDDHSDLTTSLENLVARVEVRREDLQKTLEW